MKDCIDLEWLNTKTDPTDSTNNNGPMKFMILILIMNIKYTIVEMTSIPTNQCIILPSIPIDSILEFIFLKRFLSISRIKLPIALGTYKNQHNERIVDK
ncbi:hypothetical protein [Candidatus Nitrosocosmicus arcticus]|uniref:hypothetical protein n=1 Tax=Candidatus Nitrosocosmicus arcticus TaxID=2035267 RepID=UPI0011A0401E|nr:hypothetical protein [Candidatus Nitrosocosmicus arcticus]